MKERWYQKQAVMFNMWPDVLQVSLSQVFVGMRQVQHQHLFVVLDWGVAHAKFEEVMQALSMFACLCCSNSSMISCTCVAKHFLMCVKQPQTVVCQQVCRVKAASGN